MEILKSKSVAMLDFCASCSFIEASLCFFKHYGNIDVFVHIG